MILFYLLTLFVTAVYAVLMLSYLYGWAKTPVQQLNSRTPNTRVSIIIPARNEEQNILNCLVSVSRQKYPSELFEIIVIDDHSSDGTAMLVQSLMQANLKLISLLEGQAGKKTAITEGIKIANGKLTVTTDADCVMNENWLSSIVAFYEEQHSKMIVAPVILKNENSIQQIMQSQEMTVLTASACGSLFWNQPILCSGANLAYEKEAFIAVNGFEGVDKTATGDDVFLMLKIHNKFPGQIGYLRSTEGIVFTDPAPSSPEALRQRKRWASKSFSYGFSHITWIAGLVFLTNFLILISGILSVINLKFVFALIICFSVKSLVDFMLLNAASSFFGKRVNLFVFTLASLMYPVYVSLIGFISPFINYSWKGRES